MTIVGLPERPRCEAKADRDAFGSSNLTLWFNHWPPTDNATGRFGQGRYFGNPKKKAFYTLVDCARIEFKLPKISGWVVIEYRHVFRDLTHGDPSNFIKVTQDALQHAGLIENDRHALSQVLGVLYPWDFTATGPAPRVGMEVIVRPLADYSTPSERPKNWKGWKPAGADRA